MREKRFVCPKNGAEMVYVDVCEWCVYDRFLSRLLSRFLSGLFLVFMCQKSMRKRSLRHRGPLAVGKQSHEQQSARNWMYRFAPRQSPVPLLKAFTLSYRGYMSIAFCLRGSRPTGSAAVCQRSLLSPWMGYACSINTLLLTRHCGAAFCQSVLIWCSFSFIYTFRGT